jgi:dTMP kinase
MPARYIVLEGGDGCGKDTQLPLIEEHMKQAGMRVVIVREPYDSPTFGEPIRDMFFARNGQPDFSRLDPIKQARYMNQARTEVVGIIAERLREGYHVLTSRNWLSTMAYQGHAQSIRSTDIEQLRLACHRAAKAVIPDLLVLIDLPASEALARQGDKEKDVHEILPVEFHNRVCQGYLAEVALVEATQEFPVVVIAASGVAVADMTDRIWAQIEPLVTEGGADAQAR